MVVGLLQIHFQVLILPMRNGNTCGFTDTVVPYRCSYPTYEEWKQSSRTSGTVRLYRSYPTYEEWKPDTVVPYR